MTDFQWEKNVLEKLTEARESSERKHQLLEQGCINFEKTLSETFKPVPKPLKKLAAAAKSNKFKYTMIKQAERKNSDYVRKEENSQIPNTSNCCR